MGKTRLLGEHPDGRRPGSAQRHHLVSDSVHIGTWHSVHDRLSRRRYRLVGPARRAQPDDGAAVNVPAPLGGTLLARGSPSGVAPTPQENGALMRSALEALCISVTCLSWARSFWPGSFLLRSWRASDPGYGKQSGWQRPEPCGIS